MRRGRIRKRKSEVVIGIRLRRIMIWRARKNIIIGTVIENRVRRISRAGNGAGGLVRGAVMMIMMSRIGGKGKVRERKRVLEMYIEYNAIVVRMMVVMRRV